MRILTLLSAFVILSVAEGCATYKRCQEKFATATTRDTVTLTIPVLVPRDSIVTSFVTDTTYLRIEEQQGRARLIVERTPRLTSIKAECDTVTIYKKIRLGTTVNHFGVNARYKRAAWAFGSLWLATMLGLMLASRYRIERR